MEAQERDLFLLLVGICFIGAEGWVPSVKSIEEGEGQVDSLDLSCFWGKVSCLNNQNNKLLSELFTFYYF